MFKFILAFLFQVIVYSFAPPPKKNQTKQNKNYRREQNPSPCFSVVSLLGRRSVLSAAQLGVSSADRCVGGLGQLAGTVTALVLTSHPDLLVPVVTPERIAKQKSPAFLDNPNIKCDSVTCDLSASS